MTSPPNERTKTFSLKSGVKVFGGFAGTESSLEERDYEANETILSGDLNSDDEPNFVNRSDNCYHVITATGVSLDPSTELDGFTIRDGFADGTGTGQSFGGGLYIIDVAIGPNKFSSNPRVFNCTFEHNVARRVSGTARPGSGGAVYSLPTLSGFTANTLVFSNCVFKDNVAGRTGGAVSISNANILTLDRCVFVDNQTIDTASPNSGIGGGALYLSGSAGQFAALTDCDFETNLTTAGEGGAAFCIGLNLLLQRCGFVGNTANSGSNALGRGGGLYITVPRNIAIIDSRFIDNTSQANFYSGGGVAIIGAATVDYSYSTTIVNSQFINNSSVGFGGGGGLVQLWTPMRCVNSLFAGNEANHGGAAICQETGYEDEEVTILGIEFINCTVSDNAASDANGIGGVYVGGGAEATIRNCILWGNRANGAGGSGAQIQQGSHDVTYSCIEGGFTGTGNINADPLFVDSASGDYRLKPCSPASDAADYDVVPADAFDVNDNSDTSELTPDLDLLARAFQNPYRDDDGVGEEAYTDMGAYELHIPSCAAIGDMTDDSVIDGRDIQLFIDCFMAPSEGDCVCADLDFDGVLTTIDRDCLVSLLLTGVSCEITGCAIGQRSFPDCNGNGIHDVNDIGSGASPDCNANGIPDECEIDENSTAPGGPWYCDADCADDVNNNGVPDECEGDCNTNGIPDEKDIADETSADVNSNGIPDECEPDCNTNGVPDDWDIATAASADCNGNGIPDECEPDCNTNGVPDDCDVDPTDPDGDEWVSPDCNGNEYPDECDMSLPPPFGSLDCNTNGLPDECDIAECESDPACDDCNENGIPDGCDIAAEISEDANTNGIPDECEGESLMGGGGENELTGETPAPPGDSEESMTGEGEFDEEAAWEAFFEWSMAQCWGSDCEASGAEQFAAMVAKLRELGLPVGSPY